MRPSEARDFRELSGWDALRRRPSLRQGGRARPVALKERHVREMEPMILIALGANLDHPRYGPPRETLEAALEALQQSGVAILGRSRWFRSAPTPPSEQPWFVNAVASAETSLSPADLLAKLHEIEAGFGRVRHRANEARVLDLDLLAYHDRESAPGESPILPHPRLAERAFVVLPLAEVAPDWRHPVSGLSAAEMANRLDPAETAEPLD